MVLIIVIVDLMQQKVSNHSDEVGNVAEEEEGGDQEDGDRDMTRSVGDRWDVGVIAKGSPQVLYLDDHAH